jgi:Immunity protein 8
MHRKLKWKRPGNLPLFLITLTPDHPAELEMPGGLFTQFTARVGIKGRSASEEFGLMVATPEGMEACKPPGYKGIIIERYDQGLVFRFVEEVIRSVKAKTMAEAETKLAEIMWRKFPATGPGG